MPTRLADALPHRRGRASIAVMPFADRSAQAGVRGGLLAENLALTLCAAAVVGALGALSTVVFRELLSWM
ncbi:hypothetical protein LLE87_35890, partial [Paenibacillus polymyxa]|nr:hypothetical protein [Paenibacillus polymyxa]